MTDDTMAISALRAYLDARPNTAPDRVLRTAMGRIATTPQRPSILWGLPRISFALAGTAAVLVVAVVIGAILGMRLDDQRPGETTAPIAPTPSAEPTTTPLPSPTRPAVVVSTSSPATPDSRPQTENFERPFRYELPDDEMSVYLDLENGFEMVSERTTLTGDDGNAYPQFTANPDLEGGVFVVSTAGAGVDHCPSADNGGGNSFHPVTIPPGADVASFLAYEAGIDLVSSPALHTIAGRPATEVSVARTGCYDHLHVGPVDEQDGPWQSLQFAWPDSRNYLVPLADTTFVIQIWAHSPEGLEAWLPRAQAFIDSIELVSEPVSQQSQTTSNFEPWFSYRVPDEVSTMVTRDLSGLYAIVAPSSEAAGWYPDDGPYPLDSDGLIVVSLTGATFDACPRSPRAVQGEIVPQGDVLSQLREEGGLEFETRATTISGFPAVFTDTVSVAPGCTASLHIDEVDLSLIRPTQRLYFVPFTTTIFIQVWAATPDELERWLPVAGEIIESLRFCGAYCP